jgi:ABC-type glycerol-3-phosphate transport system substrate-binding protein
MSRKKLSRRDFLRAGTAGAAGLALAACQTEKEVTREVEKVVEETVLQTIVEKATVVETVLETVVVEMPAEQEHVTIEWWNQFGAPDTELDTETGMGKMVAVFMEIYPWITVEYELSGGPPGGGEYIEALLARIAAGDPPHTATLWTPPVQFAARGSLTAIDDMMATAKWAKAGSFYEGVMSSCIWRGETYGLPASAGVSALFVNTTMLDEKGIPTAREDFPKTWDELKALSAEFVEWDGDELVHAGFPPWNAGWTRPQWSGLNGSQLFNAVAERYTIDSPENVEWWEFMVGWLDEQYQGDIELLNLYGPYGDTQDSAVKNGRALATENGSWACLTNEGWDFPFDVYEYPVGPSGSTSVCAWWPNWFVVSAGVPYPEEAFLFIEWMATKGWEIWYLDWLDTPAWKDFAKNIVTLGLVDKYGMEQAQNLNQFFDQYLGKGVDMWNSPVEDFANNMLGQAVDEILHKVKSPTQALREAQELAQDKLEETLAS